MSPKICQDKFKKYPVVFSKILLLQLRNHKGFTGCWLCSCKSEQETIHFYVTCNGQTVGKNWLFFSSVIVSLTKTCKRCTTYLFILKKKKKKPLNQAKSCGMQKQRLSKAFLILISIFIKVLHSLPKG